jgi:Flp pilus assembly protein TadG
MKHGKHRRNWMWMLQRLRNRGRDESGAVLVIVAVLTVLVFIPLCALAIDIPSYYQAQRQAQAAADAGALAGAGSLASSPSSAAGEATTYAQTNFPGSSPTVTVNTTSNSVTVNVTATTPTFFGKLMGFPTRTVGARAVAGATFTSTTCSPGSTCYAVFAADSSCSDDGVTMGGGTNITGGVHSNGSLDVGGGGSSFGPTTYGNGTGCTVTPVGYAAQSNTFTSGPTQEAPITTWPINYATDFPACTPGSTCTGACDVTTTPCPSANQTPSFCTQSFNAAVTLVSYYPYTLTSGNIYCDVGSGTASIPTTWTGALTADQSGSPAIESSFVAGSVTLGGGDSINACGYSATGYAVSGCSTAVPAPTTANYPVVYAVGPGTSITNSGGGGTFLGDFFAPNGTIDMGGGDSTTFLEAQDVSVSSGGFTGDGPSDNGTGSGSSGTEALLQ